LHVLGQRAEVRVAGREFADQVLQMPMTGRAVKLIVWHALDL
jgi:hypothetical protein